MQSNDQRGPGRATKTSTAVLAVVLLVTGLAVGAGATWFALSRDDGGTAASADGCAEFRSVDLVVAPEMYSVVVAALADVTPDCVQVDPALRSGMEVARGASLGSRLPDVWIPEAHFVATEAFLGRAPRPRLLVKSLARTPVVLVGGNAARRFATWGDAEASGLVSVPNPESSVAGALAVTAPEAEARAVGRTRGRRPPAPGPVRPGAGRPHRGGRGRDGPAGHVRAALTAAGGRHRAAAADGDGRADLRDLTPPVGAPVLDFPLMVAADAAPGSRALARALAEHLEGEVGRSLISDEGLRAPRQGRRCRPATARGQGDRRGGLLVEPAQRAVGHARRRRRLRLDGRRRRQRVAHGPAGRRGPDRAGVPARPRAGRSVGLLHRPGRAGSGLARARAHPSPRRPALRPHPALRPPGARRRDVQPDRRRHRALRHGAGRLPRGAEELPAALLQLRGADDRRPATRTPARSASTSCCSGSRS